MRDADASKVQKKEAHLKGPFAESCGRVGATERKAVWCRLPVAQGLSYFDAELTCCLGSIINALPTQDLKTLAESQGLKIDEGFRFVNV
jgi:hypothetical protein